MQKTIYNKYLGEIECRYNPRARRIIFRFKDGRFQATMPVKTGEQQLDAVIAENLGKLLKLKEEKKGIVPANGVILSGCEIEVQEGDSVYDVLVRACRQNKIHMDADYTPAYGSAYIKGIANLYERDCGSLSGWTYRVNGVFQSVGCSSYDANEGDVIEFLYTCDLGADVGNGFNG